MIESQTILIWKPHLGFCIEVNENFASFFNFTLVHTGSGTWLFTLFPPTPFQKSNKYFFQTLVTPLSHCYTATQIVLQVNSPPLAQAAAIIIP